jgi:hypothetical protein
MMRTTCPACSRSIVVYPTWVGTTTECPHCRHSFTVPAGLAEGDPVRTAEENRPYSPPLPERTEWTPQPARPDAGPPLPDRVGAWMGAYTGDGPPPPMNLGKRIMMAFLGLFLTALFGSLFFFLIYSFVEVQASQSWQVAKGKILGSGVGTKTERTSRGRRYTVYSAAVAYEYTVDGKTLTGSQLGFGSDQTYGFLAGSVAGRYKEGQEVPVYYDPADPKHAVLQRTVLFGSFIMGGVGLFVFYVGLRLLLTHVLPTMKSSNSRWLPWSRRITWPDVPLVAFGVFFLILWLPMLFGL